MNVRCLRPITVYKIAKLLRGVQIRIGIPMRVTVRLLKRFVKFNY